MATVAACLIFEYFHFDIHNAFQSTPDHGDINGNHTWLKINCTWLDYIVNVNPQWWPQASALLRDHSKLYANIAIPGIVLCIRRLLSMSSNCLGTKALLSSI
jgi:hypothetical protein